ncbi:MAG: transcriptional repressor LexA [Lachnospiraceae bacterium]|nr:transcriptional repressor LexA [Lachnospiraceae bacterium]
MSREKNKLTEKDYELLEYIKDNIMKKGFPPTVREMCKFTGLSSTSSVFAHLNKLEANDLIKRDPAKPRCIEIIDDSFNQVRAEMASVPIVGRVACGEPILASQNIEGYFPLPVEMLPNEEVFVLIAKGDSMINIGIFEGDYVFVKKASTASNGETVVAMIEDSATIKTFYKFKDHIELKPENDTMDPIIVNGNVDILGKVFGVFRLCK